MSTRLTARDAATVRALLPPPSPETRADVRRRILADERFAHLRFLYDVQPGASRPETGKENRGLTAAQ